MGHTRYIGHGRRERHRVVGGHRLRTYVYGTAARAKQKHPPAGRVRVVRVLLRWGYAAERVVTAGLVVLRTQRDVRPRCPAIWLSRRR